MASSDSNEGAQGLRDGETDEAHATTEISYCPNLGLYHYKRADGAESLFDRAKLEMALEAFLRQGDSRMAEFMSTLTGYARRYPHVVVILSPDGNYALRKMEIPEEERGLNGIVEDNKKTSR